MKKFCGFFAFTFFSLGFLSAVERYPINEIVIPIPSEQSDDAITMQVQSLIHVSNINVKTLGGIVFLSGTVNSEATKAYIGSAAQGVQGVRRVENNIIVTSS